MYTRTLQSISITNRFDNAFGFLDCSHQWFQILRGPKSTVEKLFMQFQRAKNRVLKNDTNLYWPLHHTCSLDVLR
ncbi:hypothetical protein L596_030224 [Steinernema carpocapsae]|uniref:Uncharacterized protein n=1 Tax=Steinernema carpocapsae TaxID=34508 RepID=A0A4U5LS33_STECR|nr:hypothetical protein L596_030224 [Steinernema carpocapsae]